MIISERVYNMSQYVVEGGHRLGGTVKVQGAKNSALPILAAAVAVGKPCVIHNCPRLTDIDWTVRILQSLGCEVHRSGNSISVDAGHITCNAISDELMREMRSSIIFLGALLSATGEAVMTAPGGCDIGVRPVDLHLLSMKQLGVSVSEEYGKIHCKCNSRIRGGKITLSFPSVGATENIILASVRATGTTTIINAAREPEIVDLAKFLNSCGAHISGAGESTIIIEGAEKLHPSHYTIMPDRIAACTYMAAVAVTGGTAVIEDIIPNHLTPVISCFEQSGCRVSLGAGKLQINSPSRLNRMETIRTMPYPGFPTDCQAILMSMASVSNGTTVINENIFENRFKHVGELNRMGADIKVHDKIAVINGVSRLQGACVVAPDLRAGAALVIAGLNASGSTTVENIRYIDRGYEDIDICLKNMGAKIKRIG